jgi:hypothetical protein
LFVVADLQSAGTVALGVAGIKPADSKSAATFGISGSLSMSTDTTDRQQQKVSEFLRLLPLTAELAGLPHSEHGKYYNEGQMEARATTIRAAYKIARQIVLDAAK